MCTDTNATDQCLDASGVADPALDFSIGFKDSVVTADGTFTGADNGIDSLSFTSGIGDGFTVTLDQMVVDRGNLFIQFNNTADEVSRLEDVGSDTLVWFGLGATNPPGWVRFRGSHSAFGYAINGRWDHQGAMANTSAEIAGKFVRRQIIPEPATLTIFGLGSIGLGVMGRRGQKFG